MEAISAYMAFNNKKRPHTKLKYKTPSEVEAEYATVGLNQVMNFWIEGVLMLFFITNDNQF